MTATPAGAKPQGNGRRRLYLDRSPGEARGVVTLDGRPERLLIRRDGDATPRLGARYWARVSAVTASSGLARLDLGGGLEGSLRLSTGRPLAEGARLEAEVVAEPARGKPAMLRAAAEAAVSSAGPPGLVAPAPAVERALQAFAPDEAIVGGEAAREMADAAQDEALAREHRLAGGVMLTIEPTRALIAVDVDLDPSVAGGQSLKANLAAIAQTARLLRLGGLGGLAAIDLVGFPREKARLHTALLQAFADDGPEVVIGPLSRFGVVELAKPRGVQPLREQLLDGEGRPTARTLAQAAVRDLERQGRFDPGALMEAVCAPAVAAALRPLAVALGPRFSVRERTDQEGIGGEAAGVDIRRR